MNSADNFNIYPNTRLGKLVKAKKLEEILDLCDDFCPGQPPEYFFDRLATRHLCSVADPVNFFRIRIRGSGFSNTDPDPDPSDPKKTGSYLDMFLMFSKINIYFMAFFLPNLKIL